jgi:hypothetical protein
LVLALRLIVPALKFLPQCPAFLFQAAAIQLRHEQAEQISQKISADAQVSAM